MGEATPSTRLSDRFRAALGAWQPFTGRGIAAFAGASGIRVLVFQAAFALVAVLVLVWSLRIGWIPVIQRALAALPAGRAGISEGQFRWPDTNAVLLATSPQLALVADPSGSGDLGQNGDLQLELRARELRFRGLLGQVSLTYPTNLDLPLDHTGAAAAWGAWRAPLFALLALGTGAALLLSWWALATLYALFTWLAAQLTGRSVSLGGAWRLAAAALLPGALLLTVGITLYAIHWIRLPGLAALFALHLPVGWFATGWGVSALPRGPVSATTTGTNPFEAGDHPTRTAAAVKNPFRR